MNSVIESYVLHGKLSYVMFKRLCWFLEMIFLLLVLVLDIERPVKVFLCAYQIIRVAAEIQNHQHLTKMFNVRDHNEFPKINKSN
jgi:hypothetical protein